MTFAIIANADQESQYVVSHHHFAWIAEIVAGWREHFQIPGGDLVIVDTRDCVRDLMDLHRSYCDLAEENSRLQIEHERERRKSFRRIRRLTYTLAGLVSRDDEGRWTTVHDVDTVMPDQGLLSGILA